MMMASVKNDFPKTFVFKTAKSTIGLLEIRGFTDKPHRRMMIYYNLAQNGRREK
jgi:hypothetical protein